jgi:hypothetical protein
VAEKINNALNLSQTQVDYLLSPPAIRERAKQIFELTDNNQTHFKYQADQLTPTVEYVLKTIRKNYPDLIIPFHSRWGHFRVGGIDRVKNFDHSLSGVSALEKARTKLDLVITSVLLDAGAGAEWSYAEASTSKSFARSEGLGVASFHMFCSGVMSSDKKSTRADAGGLRAVSTDDLKTHFQVTTKNPLIGVEGRVQLLNNLARALENKTIFKDGRPGNIVDYLSEKYGQSIPATGILRAVLDGLGTIWPGRITAVTPNGSVNLGDVWTHSKLGKPGSFESLVPIHKLSQWLTYSLIEPIQDAGFTVTGVEDLTGLAEYRNGGLLIDTELLTLKNPSDLATPWAPDSELIIEWRALTIHLLDMIGARVQQAIDKTPQDFPLAKVLEGGTWWAGRFIAQEKRAGGTPPLNMKSDGTVF